ncbi:unnamed protein product [Parnassius apollo]|uniref:(apollo) hypothetical protein n=1 Tax=Parnassius apollo TaxID=110799 RepID=A0A8S3XU11_PARAO|nr:unnamed protein product [Parnassius apollo]
MCQVYDSEDKLKPFETDPVRKLLKEIASQHSNTLSETSSEKFCFCNEASKPHLHQFSEKLPLNENEEKLDIKTGIKKHRRPEYLTYIVNEDDYNIRKTNLILHLCTNSTEKMNSSSKHDYQSSCLPDKKNTDLNSTTCVDKTTTEICQSKSKDALTESCNSDKQNKNSTTNLAAKTASSTNTPKYSSSSENINKKKLSEGSTECLPKTASNTCCSALKLPKCSSETIRKESPKQDCCSLDKTRKSLTDFHKCSSQIKEQTQSSNKENISATESKDNLITSEPVLTCNPETKRKNEKECKTKPSYCSNTLDVNDLAMPEEHASSFRLIKCPPTININNLIYEQQDLEQAMICTDIENCSGSNVLPDSHRNFKAYFGLKDSGVKSENVPNNLKVNVIPSNSNLADSTIKIKIDQNETVSTCVTTSDDFTSIAKDFFGNIYKRTKDAMTAITSESARFLNLVRRTSESCNTDRILTPPKICENKSVETPFSYLQQRKESGSLTMTDQSTTYMSNTAIINRITTESSESLLKYCTCNKTLAPEFSDIILEEPAPPSNSVFTTIKSKIFSIFREDCDKVSTMLKLNNSKTSMQSNDFEETGDSQLSIIDEIVLQKPT